MLKKDLIMEDSNLRGTKEKLIKENPNYIIQTQIYNRNLMSKDSYYTMINMYLNIFFISIPAFALSFLFIFTFYATENEYRN